MTTQTLTTYYCAICDKIANLFTKILSETKFDPKFDHKGYKELQSLSDHDLRDIGICRGDIHYISSGGKIQRGDN